MYYSPPNFYPVNLQHSSYKHVFSIRVENGVDPKQMATLALSCPDMPSQQFFSLFWTFPKVSCPRAQHSASGEA